MSRLIKEFSTPFFFSKWDSASVQKSTVLSVIKAEIERATKASGPRGQEVVRSRTNLESHFTYSVPLELSRRGKRETNDRLHLETSLEPLYHWCIDCFRRLIERLAPEALNKILPEIRNSWASVYKEGDFHDFHNHPNSAFVGVYCVALPDVPPPQGALNFLDPRGGINYYSPLLPLFAEDIKTVMLSEGELVTFPGWLRHSVTPFRGAGERVTISMNLGFDSISAHAS